jgi:hypothetical protein
VASEVEATPPPPVETPSIADAPLADVVVRLPGSSDGPAFDPTLVYRSITQPVEQGDPSVELRDYVPVPLGTQMIIDADRLPADVGMFPVPPHGMFSASEIVLKERGGTYALDAGAGNYALVVQPAGRGSTVSFLVKLFDPVGTDDHDAPSVARTYAKNGACPAGTVVQYGEWEVVAQEDPEITGSSHVDQVVVVVPSADAPQGYVLTEMCAAGPDGRLYLLDTGGSFSPRSNVPDGLPPS